MDKFVFLHIPKTAGTSFVDAIKKAIGADRVSPSFNAGVMSQDQAEELDHFDVIAGHISINDINRYFSDRNIITVIREPIERCISWYYYARSLARNTELEDVNAAQTLSVDDFFRAEKYLIFRNIYNRQVRQLGGHVFDLNIDFNIAMEKSIATLASANWVGRVETIDEDIETLKHQFPAFANLALRKTNVTPNKGLRNELSSKTLNNIEAYNEYDLALYEKMKR